MMESASFWWGFLFSFIGMGFLMYGRRERSATALACGLGLVIYPYFVSSSLLMVLIGCAFCALPALIHRW
ncbi:MAG: hypothetical protein R3F02_09735 [Thiolinea sp.]